MALLSPAVVLKGGGGNDTHCDRREREKTREGAVSSNQTPTTDGVKERERALFAATHTH